MASYPGWWGVKAPGLLLYRCLAWILAILGVPYLLLFRRSEVRERLGGADSSVSPGRIWIHAASLGEFEAARPLIEAWSERFGVDRILVSCTNAVARERLRQRLPSGTRTRLAPLDLWPLIGRLLDREKPSCLVFVETEVWPEWIAAASTRKIPIAIVSARLSNRSFPRYRRLRVLIRPILRRIAVFGCRTTRDRDRWIAIGSPPERCEVWGNTKYDAGPQPEPKLAIGKEDRFLLVGGSLRSGEKQILDLTRTGDGEGIRLLIAIRHLERLPQWERACLDRGIRCGRMSLSGLDSISAGSSAVAELKRRDSELPPVIFIDRMGRLQNLYEIADAAFVGGTWVPVGGHNLFEPARAGTPVLFGPSIDGVRDAAEELLRRDGGRIVGDTNLLCEAIEDLRTDSAVRQRMGMRAREAAESLGGAVERTLAGLRQRAIPPETS